MDMTAWISIGSMIVILAALVLLRAKNKLIEVKPSDIVVAVLPVLVFLLATGRLQKFELSEGGVKIETAFVQAQRSPITVQVATLAGLPGEPSQADRKETDKGRALKEMEALNVDTLSVLNDQKHFVGIVDRSRLTASLLIDVADNLEK